MEIMNSNKNYRNIEENRDPTQLQQTLQNDVLELRS